VVRPFKTISRPLDDDAQTKFMSRALVPPPGRRAPVFAEERTLVDAPRPRDDSEERTIVAPLAFPKAATRLQVPAPRPPTSTLRSPATPNASFARPSAPELVPPPPPSSARLFERPSIAPLPGPVPSEHPSSPALVRDLTPSTPPPSFDAGHPRRREPMILVAGALGVLGMIFTLGILVGLIVSLRSSPGPAEASAAAGQSSVTASARSTREITAPKVVLEDGPADTLAVAKPPAPPPAVDPPASPVARVFRPAPMSVAPAAKVAAAALAKHAHPAPVDADLDAANAASDLAKAQLDASLR
jgi:hypothetical protein